MEKWGRETPWRQGQILTDGAIRKISLSAEANSDVIVIVVSHDCDIAQSEDSEPIVEVIVGKKIAAVDGNYTFAKNARRLHISFSGGKETLAAEFEANGKKQINKNQLVEFQPHEFVRLNPRELNILQKWLAARYRRSAFPDEFDRRLSSTGVKDLISKALKSEGSEIRAVYFDVGEREEVCKSPDFNPYALTIYLLYSTENTPEVAEQAAESAKTKITRAFEDKCLSKETQNWHYIELVECIAVSDRVMTVYLSDQLKRWSADHLSLRSETEQAMLHNE